MKQQQPPQGVPMCSTCMLSSSGAGITAARWSAAISAHVCDSTVLSIPAVIGLSIGTSIDMGTNASWCPVPLAS